MTFVRVGRNRHTFMSWLVGDVFGIVFSDEKIMDQIYEADIGLVFVEIKSVVATNHLNVLQLRPAIVCITHKTQTVVMCVWQRVYFGLSFTTIGSLPIVEDGFYTKA